MTKGSPTTICDAAGTARLTREMLMLDLTTHKAAATQEWLACYSRFWS
jgi:hypothetical protein